MFTYTALDTQGNWFISRQRFDSEQEAFETAMSLAEYDFISQFDVVKCKDMVCFNDINGNLN